MLRKLIKDGVHQRYYTKGGEGPLPSCSHVCKIGDDPGGLIHWSWKKGMSGEDYREERDEAAWAGDVGHGLVEAFLVGDELDLSEFPEKSQVAGRICFEKFMEWWDAHKFTFMHAELQLVSHEYLFGGTLDILARNEKNEVCLIDIKTTNALRVSYNVQCGGYGILVNENFPDDKVDHVCIVRLPKDGKPVEPLWLDPKNFPVYHKMFLANLASYYARQAMNKVDPIALRPKWKPRKKNV